MGSDVRCVTAKFIFVGLPKTSDHKQSPGFNELCYAKYSKKQSEINDCRVKKAGSLLKDQLLMKDRSGRLYDAGY